MVGMVGLFGKKVFILEKIAGGMEKKNITFSMKKIYLHFNSTNQRNNSSNIKIQH
jgi:hypothetical protein